jgi:uncharacterized membrane protein YphA (DoxX/SURF4 family)
VSKVAVGWNRFWFAPTPTSTLALLRIAFGGLAFVAGLTLWPQADLFYEPTWLGTTGARAVVVGLVLAAVCLTVGLRTRLAAAVVLGCLILLAGLDPFLFNSGDTLLRVMLLLLVLSPAGTALSVDRLRTDGSAWGFPSRPAWSLRLVQIQLAIVYGAAVVHKLGGSTWRDGTAVSYPIRIPDMVRFPVPHELADSVVAAHAMTWGTLAVEAAIPILVWSRRARPWVLGLGVGLHLGIDYSLRAGLFSWVVLASYLAFVPPETAARLLERVRRSVGTVRRLLHPGTARRAREAVRVLGGPRHGGRHVGTR